MSTRILVRKANSLITRDVLAEVMKTHQAMFGMAYVHEGSIVTQTAAPDFSKGLDPMIGAIDGLQKGTQEAACIYAFSTQPWDEASKQPFKLLVDANGNAQIVAFYGDGDYSKHAKDNTEHSPAFYSFTDFLQPKVWDLIKETGGNADKLLEKLVEETPNIIEEMGGNVSVALMIASGRIPLLRSAKNPGIDTDWGWMSSLPLAPEEKKAPPLLTLPSVKSAAPVLQLTLAATPTVVEGAKLTKAEPAGEVIRLVRARPKENLKEKDKRAFYERYNYERAHSGRGVIPNLWRRNPPPAIEVHPKYINTADFLDLAELVEGWKGALEASAAIPGPILLGERPANVGLMQISAQQKNALIEDMNWKGYLNSAGGRSADDIQKDETKVPSFYEATGLSLADLSKMTPDHLAYLRDKHPVIFFRAAFEAIRRLNTQAASPAAQSPAATGDSSPAKAPLLQLSL